MADDSGLAAELAAIKERNEALRSRYGYVGGLLVLAKAQHDVPRLVKALEAALKLADKYDAESKRLRGQIRDADRRGAMTCDAAKAIRDAIARELTGKDNANG